MNVVTVRDRFWIWGHEAGSHDHGGGLQWSSRMTPAEGAYYLGVPNLIMVRYRDRSGTPLPLPPYDQYALAFRPLRRVCGAACTRRASPSRRRCSAWSIWRAETRISAGR